MARNKKAPGHFERRGRGWRWRVCVGGRYHRYTIPTVEQLARRYGVSRRRVKRLERLIDSFIASDATRHRPARAMRKTAATRGR